MAYIIHKFFNPLTDSQFNFRLSVFFISLFIPVLLFLCLILKYKEVNVSILLVISSVIFFSPYVRTSGYWALEENYGLIINPRLEELNRLKRVVGKTLHDKHMMQN